jgi:5-methylcytosine-specific restriction protein A
MAVSPRKHYALGDSPADRKRRRDKIAKDYDQNRADSAFHKFYYTKEWRTLRILFLRRFPLCNMCGAPAKHVDHMFDVRTHWHLRLSVNNLQSLCHSCHSRKTSGFAGYKEFYE